MTEFFLHLQIMCTMQNRSFTYLIFPNDYNIKYYYSPRYSKKAGMGDKGFLLQYEFNEKEVKFYQPTFLGTDKPQYELEDVLRSEEISSVRIHVEHIIHMIHQFHILKGSIPLSMKPILEQIFTVCTYLTNFQSPICKS